MRRKTAAALLLAATGSGPTASAEPADAHLDDEERRALAAALAADAATVAAPAQGLAATMGSTLDLALILDVAGAWFSDDEPLQTGGHDPSRTGFNFQQLELAAAANVDPYFRFDANIVFAEFGVEVEEAYATTLALPVGLQARAGQFLTRFGRLNPTHPHAWRFVDQPLANGKFFGSEGARGLGAELSWLTPLPWFAEVVGSVQNADGECCARSYFGGDDLGVEGPGDLLYTTALRQFFALTGDWSLAWGLTGQFGPNATGPDNRTEIYGTDLYLRYRPVNSPDRAALSLTVEAMYRTRQVPDDRLEDVGGYAQLVWDIDAHWELGARYEYVSGVEDDPLDPEWDDDRQRVSLQGTWHPSHFSRIRLQTSFDRPAWRDDPIYATFLALEVLVGAHGAHGY